MTPLTVKNETQRRNNEKRTMNYEQLEMPNGVPVKMWTNGVPVEEDAKNQLRNIARLPIVFKHVAVMPDVHLGIGATIGSVVPTLKAIIGNQFFPGLLDRLLARRAWQGQLSEGQPDPAGDNLFHSVDGLHEVQGRFTRRSRGHALALSSARVTALLGACAALLVLLLI